MLHNPALHYVTLCPTLPCTSLHYYITVIGDPFPKIGGWAESAMSSCRACSNASTEKTEGVASRQNRRQHHSGIASCEILYLLISPSPQPMPCFHQRLISGKHLVIHHDSASHTIHHWVQGQVTGGQQFHSPCWISKQSVLTSCASWFHCERPFSNLSTVENRIMFTAIKGNR